MWLAVLAADSDAICTVLCPPRARAVARTVQTDAAAKSCAHVPIVRYVGERNTI